MINRSLTRREKKANRASAAVLGAVLLAALLMVLVLPQFYVSGIQVDGLRIVQKQQILDTAGLKTGTHLFRGVNGNIAELFQLRHVKSETALLTGLPYIKKVTVQSVFPSEIRVFVEERVEVAYIAISDGCVVIDAEGVVLEVLDQAADNGIPVIDGITAYQVQLGHKASVDLPESLNDAIVLLNDIINADKDTRVDVKLLSNIKTIRPVQDGVLFITLALPDTGEEFIVKVKNSDENLKNMEWLRFAMQQKKLAGKGKGVLDLTSTQKIFIPEK